MVDYIKEITNSWKLYRKNLIVLIPFLLSLLAFLVFFVFAAFECLFIFFIATGSSFAFENFIISPFIVFLLIFFSIIDIILLTLLNSYFESMILVMYDQVCLKGKTSLTNLFANGKTYLYLLFKVKLLKNFIICLLPFLIMSILPLILFLKKHFLLGILFSGLFGFIYLIYLFFVTLGLLFLQPIITTTKNKSAIELIKKSFKYSFNASTVTITTWGLGVVLSFAINIVLLPLIIIERLLTMIFPLIVVITIPLRTFIQLFMMYYILMFRFKVYYSENKIKTYSIKP